MGVLSSALSPPKSQTLEEKRNLTSQIFLRLRGAHGHFNDDWSGFPTSGPGFGAELGRTNRL